MERGNVYLRFDVPSRMKTMLPLGWLRASCRMPIRRPISGGFLRDIASEMRRNPTPAERRAWELLRNRRCFGLKFRRQHVVGGFVVDFYCAELRLAVEVDGPVHEDPRQRWRDEARTAALHGAGMRVVRIQNAELSRARLQEVLLPFSQELTQRPPSPYHGEGDRG
jgi:very-short-patch-repair endonuclease